MELRKNIVLEEHLPDLQALLASKAGSVNDWTDEQQYDRVRWVYQVVEMALYKADPKLVTVRYHWQEINLHVQIPVIRLLFVLALGDFLVGMLLSTQTTLRLSMVYVAVDL